MRQGVVIALHSGLKKCNKCKNFKPREEFGNCKQTKDGLQYRCRVCRNADKRAYIANNPEKESTYQKRSYSKHRAKRIAYVIEYQRTNKDAINARRRELYKRKKLAQQKSGI